MSYKSPSRIINRQAQEVQSGGQRIQNQILETTAEYQKSVELQKKQLEQLELENVQLESNFIDRVNSSTQGHGEIDKEVVGTFDTIIEESRENKRLADLGEANGGISKREYMLRQKSIETAPQDFKAQEAQRRPREAKSTSISSSSIANMWRHDKKQVNGT